MVMLPWHVAGAATYCAGTQQSPKAVTGRRAVLVVAPGLHMESTRSFYLPFCRAQPASTEPATWRFLKVTLEKV